MQYTPHMQTNTAASSVARARGLALAVLLQAGFVCALVTGLQSKIQPARFVDMFADVVPDMVTDAPPPPLPPTMAEPAPVQAIVPEFTVEGAETATAITMPVAHPESARPSAAKPAASIVATHTIPPYPMLALRLGQEGVVQLRLEIDSEGRVRSATVIQSSGSEELDAAAQKWIVAHWRYRPALSAEGAPMASSSTVAVRFDLKNAR